MKYVLVGLTLVAAVVGFVLWQNQDKRLILEGSIQKVRVQSVDDTNTAAVVEVRLNNSTALPFEIKRLTISIETKAGKLVEGTLFRAKDLDAFMNFYKASLGVRYNESLHLASLLKSKTVVDRTVAANFPLPLAEVEGRKRVIIQLEAIDGKLPTVISER
jgi:ABC-type uncharacterized transport system ATPase subunit